MLTEYEEYDYTVNHQERTFNNNNTKRRSKKRIKQISAKPSGLSLKEICPKTKNQQSVFDAYRNGDHCVLHGVAGTGKTFILSFLALQEILNTSKQKLVYIRSVVPSRDIGFLPGTEIEKSKVYESPYESIVQEIAGRGDAYAIFKRKKQIEFLTTSFLRGTTIDNAVVIVDEAQNMSFQELDTIITRIGNNTRICIAGDFRQSDLQFSGLMKFMTILQRINNFSFIDFSTADIVRSGLVKDYIIAREHFT